MFKLLSFSCDSVNREDGQVFLRRKESFISARSELNLTAVAAVNINDNNCEIITRVAVANTFFCLGDISEVSATDKSAAIVFLALT